MSKQETMEMLKCDCGCSMLVVEKLNRLCEDTKNEG